MNKASCVSISHFITCLSCCLIQLFGVNESGLRKSYQNACRTWDTIFHAIRNRVAWSLDTWKHEPQCLVWYLSGCPTHMNITNMNISHTRKFHSYEKMPPMNISHLRRSSTYDNLSRIKISHVWTSLTFVYLTHVNSSSRTIWHLWNFHTWKFNLMYVWRFHTFEYLT